MSELSDRFSQAVDFVKRNGYAKNSTEIARTLRVNNSVISMAVRGDREPTWELLLDFCDAYPVNFWWLRTGKGSIVKTSDRELQLLKRIEELELMVRKLKE